LSLISRIVLRRRSDSGSDLPALSLGVGSSTGRKSCDETGRARVDVARDAGELVF
jgi:hypothetical protein